MPQTDRTATANARWIALVVVCLAQLMAMVDATIVNVALPSIQRGLHFTASDLTWVVNGYTISFGSFLLFAGRLGDLIGRRRTFLVGIALFTLASAFCGVIDNRTLLIAARFLQGLGGAGASSAIMAIIAVEFPQPAERAKAMSIYMFVVSGGGSLGLLAGGVITQLLDWHWIFFVNLPVGAATFVLGRIWISDHPGLGFGRDVDWAGPLFVTAAMIVGVYGIVTSSTYGWGSTHTLGFAGAAVVLLGAFIAVEARIANPIMPLRIFAVPGLAASNLVRALVMAGMFASFFIGVLYLQHVLGYGVLSTGLAFLPQTMTLAALSFGATAALVRRFGARAPVVAGTVCCGVALVLLARLGTHASYVAGVLPAFVLFGVGAGLAMMPLLTIAMAHVQPADAGMASGIINTSLQLAGAIAVAVFGTLAASRTRTLLAAGHTQHSALLGGYHLAFTVALGCVAAAVLASLTLLRGPRRAQADVAGQAATVGERS